MKPRGRRPPIIAVARCRPGPLRPLQTRLQEPGPIGGGAPPRRRARARPAVIHRPASRPSLRGALVAPAVLVRSCRTATRAPPHANGPLQCPAVNRGGRWMKVIGVGFGRTGTLSLKAALER